MRSRPELPRSLPRTETNENDAERPPITTQITAVAILDASGATIALPADLAEIVHAWHYLDPAIRAAMMAMVRPSFVPRMPRPVEEM